MIRAVKAMTPANALKTTPRGPNPVPKSKYLIAEALSAHIGA
jgi:hypothetical protein